MGINTLLVKCFVYKLETEKEENNSFSSMAVVLKLVEATDP